LGHRDLGIVVYPGLGVRHPDGNCKQFLTCFTHSCLTPGSRVAPSRSWWACHHLKPSAVPRVGGGTPTALLVREGVPGLLLDISQSPCVGVGTPTVLLVREGVPGLLLDISQSPRVGVSTPTALLVRGGLQDCYWTSVSPCVGVGTPTALLVREGVPGLLLDISLSPVLV